MKTARPHRRIRIALLALLLLLLLAPWVAWILLGVPAIQDRLVGVLNERLSQVGSYAIRIEGLRGRPPLHATLESLTLSDADGAWFEARGLRLRIDGRAGLAGRLRIREAYADEAILRRLPRPSGEPAPRAEDEEWPQRIPGFLSLDRLRIPRLRVEPEAHRLPGGGAVELRLEGDARASPVEGLAAGLRIHREGAVPTRLRARVQWSGGGTPVRVWADLEEAAGGWLDEALPWPMEGGLRAEVEASLRSGLAHGDLVFRSGTLGRGQVSVRAERAETWEVEAEFRTRGLVYGPVRIDVPRLTLRAWMEPGAERLTFEGTVRDRRAFASVRAEAYRTAEAIGLRDLTVESGPVTLRANAVRTTSDGLVEGWLEARGLNVQSLPFLTTVLPAGLPAAWQATGSATVRVEAEPRDGRQFVRAEVDLEEPGSAWAQAARAHIGFDLHAPWDRPQARGVFEAEALRAKALDGLWPDGWSRFRVEADLVDGRLALVATTEAVGMSARVRMSTEAGVGWLRAGAPGWAEHPVEGELAVEVQAERLPGGLAAAVRELRGRIALDLAGRGSLAEPELEGRFAWSEGGLWLPDLGARLTDIRVVLVGARNTLRIEEAHATDGAGGRLRAQGQVYIPGLHVAPRIDLAAEAVSLLLLDLPYATARVGGELQITPGVDGRHTLGGTLSTRNAQFRIPARLPPHLPRVRVVERGALPSDPAEPAREAPWLRTVDLDVALHAGRLQVRGRGLDSEWEGRLRLLGDAAAPELVGTIGAVRGRLQFLGRRFQIEEARLDWSGPAREPPVFYCRATARAGGIRAWVEVRGDIAAPVITLLSDPPGPEDEVLARVLFGRGLERLSPFQAVRLAHGLRVLQGGGDTWDIMARGQQVLQVDQIDLVQDDEADGLGSVSVGKYVGDRLYIEGAMGLGGSHDRFTAELELTPSITLETEASPGLREGLRLRWSRDY